MKKNKIAAVVVTYNRLKYLKKVIQSLKDQTIKIDNILVINNSSADGTLEWLNTQIGIQVITQPNVGGSGGFYRGIKEVYDAGYDYIWCMDDDVYPTPDCLEQLLNHMSDNVGIACPRRIFTNGEICYGEVKQFNLTDIFKPLHTQKLSNAIVGDNDTIEIEGIAFEGPLFRKETIEKIGLPNKDLFILFDDSDYSYRATLAGLKVLYCKHAILNKEYFGNSLTKNEIARNNTWKIYYEIRNNSYFHKKYGRNKILKTIKPLFLLVRYYLVFIKSFFSHIYPSNSIIVWTKAYFDGQLGKLGKL